MNRYTWYVTHDWKVPYPGDAKLYAPADVPGAYIPSAELPEPVTRSARAG